MKYNQLKHRIKRDKIYKVLLWINVLICSLMTFAIPFIPIALVILILLIILLSNNQKKIRSGFEQVRFNDFDDN